MNYLSKIKYYLRFIAVLKMSIPNKIHEIALIIWNNHRNKYMCIVIYNTSIFMFVHT